MRIKTLVLAQFYNRVQVKGHLTLFWWLQHRRSDERLVVHQHKAFPICTTNRNPRCCPEKYRICRFYEGEWDIERHQFGFSTILTRITSMNLLRITIFKRHPGFPPADKTAIILHLHDKCVSASHVCMYVWVLKRTLAVVGHGFSSFYLSTEDGKRPFNVEPGWLSLLFIWVFIISHCQPESFEVESGALLWCGISHDTKALHLWVWVHLHLCVFPTKSCVPLHLHVNSSKCFHLLII